MSAVEWISFLVMIAFAVGFTEWCDSRVKIEKEKTRQAEIAAKEGKEKP